MNRLHPPGTLAQREAHQHHAQGSRVTLVGGPLLDHWYWKRPYTNYPSLQDYEKSSPQMDGAMTFTLSKQCHL